MYMVKNGKWRYLRKLNSNNKRDLIRILNGLWDHNLFHGRICASIMLWFIWSFDKDRFSTKKIVKNKYFFKYKTKMCLHNVSIQRKFV